MDDATKILEREMSEKEYNKLKLELEDLQKRKKKKITLISGVFSAVLFSVIFSILFLDSFNYDDKYSATFFALVLGCALGIAVSLYMSMILEIKESHIRREMLEYEAEHIQNEVEEDVFENSIKMSYKYLDQYYFQTREQAQRGFYVTVCVAIFGALLIGFGIIAMFLDKTQPSYITCASGVITEFISAVFFYLYNKTITSMSNYHNKLVISQNISIALKVADTLPTDDKTKTKNLIITELLKDVNSYLIRNDNENKKS